MYGCCSPMVPGPWIVKSRNFIIVVGMIWHFVWIHVNNISLTFSMWESECVFLCAHVALLSVFSVVCYVWLRVFCKLCVVLLSFWQHEFSINTCFRFPEICEQKKAGRKSWKNWKDDHSIDTLTQRWIDRQCDGQTEGLIDRPTDRPTDTLADTTAKKHSQHAENVVRAYV